MAPTAGPTGTTTGTATSGTATDSDTASLFENKDGIGAFLAIFEPDRYSGADAELLVTAFAEIESMGAAGKTLAAKRAADANMSRAGGHRNDAEWLASLTGTSVGEANEDLRLGRQLASQPGVRDAFVKGKLSRRRAGTVAGAVAVNPRAEGELVEAAQGPETLPQLRSRARHARAKARSEQQEQDHYEAIRRSRSVRTWTDDDGVFRLAGRFTPDAGASLAASLRAEADRVFNRARTAGIYEPPEAYAADALVALVTGKGIIGAKGTGAAGAGATGTSAKGNGTKAGAGTTDTGTDAATGQPTTTGDPGSEPGSEPGSDPDTSSEPSSRTPDPKAVVRLTIDLATLMGNPTGEPSSPMADIAGVGPVRIQALRELLGDAVYDLVIRDGVDIAAVCHLGRAIPVALQRALEIRDPACVVPGCGATHGLEIDHYVVPYVDGGPATMANLARLCHHHHQLRTHRGFQLLGGPGTWRWVPPKGPRGPKTDSMGGDDPPDLPDPDPPGGPRGTGPPDPSHPPGGTPVPPDPPEPPATGYTDVPLFTDRE